jgi:nicotinamidase-related amidase
MVTSTQVAIDVGRSALVLMDHQYGILEQLPAAEEVVGAAAAAISEVRARGGLIVYVRVGFTEAEFASVPEANLLVSGVLAERGRETFAADSPRTAIHAALAPQEDDIVLRKTRAGVFSTTDLDERLRQRGIDTMIIAGVSTGGCVLSTVRDASDRDYRLFVLADACADTAPEVHKFLIEKIFPKQARVITSVELGAILAG